MVIWPLGLPRPVGMSPNNPATCRLLELKDQGAIVNLGTMAGVAGEDAQETDEVVRDACLGDGGGEGGLRLGPVRLDSGDEAAVGEAQHRACGYARNRTQTRFEDHREAPAAFGVAEGREDAAAGT